MPRGRTNQTQTWVLDRRTLLGAAATGLTLAACSESRASVAPTTTSPEATASPSTSGVATPSASASTTTAGSPTATSPTKGSTSAELPRGGASIFPHYRLVGYCGHPGSSALGLLGIGDLDQRVSELEAMSGAFSGDGRTMLPVLELIATVVHASPGADGTYRTRSSSDLIQRFVDAARRHRAYLLLNIQPGRADFLGEVQAYESWLREPDVGVALDPEWAVGPGQVPGKVFGHVEAATLNAVGAYVSSIVAAHQLPEKVVLYHQLAPSIVGNEQQLQQHPGVVWVKSVDGIGSPGAKTATWNRLVALTPQPLVHLGFKVILDEDRKPGPVMTPAQVMALTPVPEYVMYE
ncbi:MAG: hypothetical protein M3Y06_00020 [Actinomycetota bacterium]|nr:hypothetical protein [Actinomycetota bacterium]